MAETARQFERIETGNDQSLSQTSNLGERALWGAGIFKSELGVNDPLTHLEQYLEKGEAALVSIDMDLITDCAERIENPRFINTVIFDRHGNDFVSRENKFSMHNMTATTEYKFVGNVIDARLYQRAKIESKEVDRLNEWFDSADPGDVFVVESMPLTKKERYTIVRFHQKINQQVLAEHILTMHNSDVAIFNELHARIGVDAPKSQSALELLDNMYTHQLGENQSFEEFLNHYIGAYDKLLTERSPGKEFKFGLEVSELSLPRDDLALVKSQSTLRSIYIDAIRALGKSDGRVTPDVLRINDELKLGMNLEKGDLISSTTARGLLDSSLQYIVATLNRAPAVDLKILAAGSKAAAVESAGYYGGEARAEGVRYEGVCPSGSAGAAVQEAAALAHAHRQNNSEKCVYCPKCDEIVDADKEYFNRGWWHCPDCKSTAPRHGVKQQALPGEAAQDKPPNTLEILARSLKRAKHEVNIKQVMKKQALTDSEFEKRRLAKKLREEHTELFRIAV